MRLGGALTKSGAIISHILGLTPDGFDAAAADVNGDGIINVTDVTAVINIILNR